MNDRPKLQRPPLELPSYPGYNDALWGTLLELANAQLLTPTTLFGKSCPKTPPTAHGSRTRLSSSDSAPPCGRSAACEAPFAI